MAKSVKGKRGRKSPFSAADVKRIVAVIAKEGLTHGAAVIRTWKPAAKYGKISLPTLAKYAKANGLVLSKGRPALEVIVNDDGSLVTKTGRKVDKYGRAVPAVAA